MIKLNRATEYGLMALRHMSRKREQNDGGVTSAREIADSYGLPFEITAKTLQRLKDTGLIQSAKGSRGGYTLVRNLCDLNLAEFLVHMEGPQAVVLCASSEPVGLSLGLQASQPEARAADSKASKAKCECEYAKLCEIKTVMGDLNVRVFEFLSGIKLADLGNLPQTLATGANQ
jgi:Rrf2 family protein